MLLDVGCVLRNETTDMFRRLHVTINRQTEHVMLTHLYLTASYIVVTVTEAIRRGPEDEHTYTEHPE